LRFEVSACAGGSPTKADAILFVHPDAVLAVAAAFERLEAIARWNAKVANTADASVAPPL